MPVSEALTLGQVGTDVAEIANREAPKLAGVPREANQASAYADALGDTSEWIVRRVVRRRQRNGEVEL